MRNRSFKKTHRRPALWLLCTAFMTLMALSGQSCTPLARHKVLSSLFDGVTHPDSIHARREAAAQQALAIASRDSLRTARKGAFFSRATVVIHPPYEEGDCTTCHKSGRSRSFAGSAALVSPVRDLCITCHDDLEAETLREENPWVHGPVAAGTCTGCHNPHQSLNKNLLHSPSSQLCSRCHEGPSKPRSPIHIDVGENSCLQCHFAHAGPSLAVDRLGNSKAYELEGTF